MLIAAILLYRYSWKINLLIPPLLTLTFILPLITAIFYIININEYTLWMGFTISEIKIYILSSYKTLTETLSGIYFILLQIAYIPLNQELKVNGKIIIDFFLCTLMFYPEIGIFTAPQLHTYFGDIGIVYAYPALIIICLLWISGVYGLNKRFEKIAS